MTTAGKRALGAGPTDPVDRARIELGRGAKVDAATAAVEQALAPAPRSAAGARGIPADKNGQPVSLATLNNELKAAGAYDESVRAEVEWCLKLRNETNHGRGARVSDARVARMIEAVDELRSMF